MIGTSSQDADSILGRQCIASYFFLKEQYEEVVLYLNTIKEFSLNDESFFWNMGASLAKLKRY